MIDCLASKIREPGTDKVYGPGQENLPSSAVLKLGSSAAVACPAMACAVIMRVRCSGLLGGVPARLRVFTTSATACLSPAGACDGPDGTGTRKLLGAHIRDQRSMLIPCMSGYCSSSSPGRQGELVVLWPQQTLTTKSQ